MSVELDTCVGCGRRILGGICGHCSLKERAAVELKDPSVDPAHPGAEPLGPAVYGFADTEDAEIVELRRFRATVLAWCEANLPPAPSECDLDEGLHYWLGYLSACIQYGPPS